MSKELKPGWRQQEDMDRFFETKKMALEIAKAMSTSKEVVRSWPNAQMVGIYAFRIAKGLEIETWENLPDVYEIKEEKKEVTNET